MTGSFTTNVNGFFEDNENSLDNIENEIDGKIDVMPGNNKRFSLNNDDIDINIIGGNSENNIKNFQNMQKKNWQNPNFKNLINSQNLNSFYQNNNNINSNLSGNTSNNSPQNFSTNNQSNIKRLR